MTFHFLERHANVTESPKAVVGVLTVLLTLTVLTAGQGQPATPAGESPPAATVAPSQLRIAITVDDIPWNGSWPGGDTVNASTRKLIAVLARHRAPVTVFVNCRPDEASRQVLLAWVHAGASVGNHTTGHRDLNSTPPQEWADAVRACDHALRSAVRSPIRYFRYPGLHQGQTIAERNAAIRVLNELGYRNAPVTIDNSDFLVAAPYLRATRAGDALARRKFGALMVEHDSAATEHSRAVARALLGRDVAHILLLHSNLMTADNLDRLLTTLEVLGAHFVSLDEALTDPVYAQPNRYTGAKGLSWLYRVDPSLPTQLPAAARWDDAEAARVRAAIRGIESFRRSQRGSL